MSGTLALAGDEPFREGCGLDAALLAAADADHVLLVPAVAAFEQPGLVVERAQAWFRDLDATCEALDLYARPDAHVPAVVDRLAAAPIIYLVGDSPMHLRSVLKGTPAWDVLTSRWADGATLAAAGGSAMVLCDPMVDPRGGAFTLGLGLVRGLAVVAQSNWSADQARRTIHLAPRGVPVVGIDARAAVVRDPSGQWSAAGTGDVVVYRDGAEAPLGSLSDLVAV